MLVLRRLRNRNVSLDATINGFQRLAKQTISSLTARILRAGFDHKGDVLHDRMLTIENQLRNQRAE